MLPRACCSSRIASQNCLALQVENEDLVFTLETLVERFDEEMAPYAVGLTQHLAAAFWRMQVPHCCLNNNNLQVCQPMLGAY